MFLSLLILAAPPDPAFVVRPADATAKVSFVVQPAAPAPAPVAAPKTVRWQWWDAFGNTWFTDEPAAPSVMPPAPGVPAPAPFVPGPASTPATSAPAAAPVSTSSPAGIPTELTLTPVPGAGRVGGTNCTSYG